VKGCKFGGWSICIAGSIHEVKQKSDMSSGTKKFPIDDLLSVSRKYSNISGFICGGHAIFIGSGFDSQRQKNK